MKKILFAVFIAALAGPAFAHHSGAMFDHTKMITVRGTVKEFQYTNPHSWLEVMVLEPNGTAVQWGFESEGPSSLLRAGITAKTFRPGDRVTVVASPMRDGRPAGSLISATKADGTVYRLFSGPKPARSH
ncbi:MAG: DUF6152 family protein [Steroidobacteraceae bacterium]